MGCDLDTIFGVYSNRLLSSGESQNHIISAANIPSSPAEVKTDKLVIKRGYHDYLECYRADLLTIAAQPKTYANLALLVFSVVFHDSPLAVDLHLTNPNSDIDRLNISYRDKRIVNETYSYVRRPSSFEYGKIRLLDRLCVDPHDLPCLYLCSDSNIALITPQDWENRRIINGFGSDIGCVYLANLLLQISEGAVNDYECRIEGSAGNGKVGPLSAECRFLLPGHRYWELYGSLI